MGRSRVVHCCIWSAFLLLKRPALQLQIPLGLEGLGLVLDVSVALLTT